MRAKYNKAIMAILGGLVTIAGVMWPGLPIDPEVVATIGAVLTTLLVALGPANA